MEAIKSFKEMVNKVPCDSVQKKMTFAMARRLVVLKMGHMVILVA